ncbi:MAG: hypothetical protein ACM3NF_05360 [Gemmatimonadota bacterium]
MTGLPDPRRRGAAASARPRRGGARLALAALVTLASCLPAVAADNTLSALEAAGWSESAPGLFASLPQRTVEIRESGIAGDFLLAPGTSLAWEKRFRDGRTPGTVLEIEIHAEGSNASSNDYGKCGGTFPVSVTAVFGRDSLDRPLKRRLLDFFESFRCGFAPGGIRLTYAAGNVAPAGSMFRTRDAETVFILVGSEDKGKRIAVRRDLAADFRAAYGRDPRGPVTRLIVRAARPSREKGTIRAGIRLAFPGTK